MPVPSPRADEHLENWLSYKQGNEGRSVATVHKYRVWILRLKDWLAPADLLQATEGQVREFTGMHLYRQKMTPSSRRVAVAAVKGFYAWCAQAKAIPSDPAASLPYPAIGRALPKAMGLHNAEKLLMQPDLSTFMGLRDAAMLSLLMGTGLRVGGLCSLNRSNLVTYVHKRVTRMALRVTEKGGHVRAVPVPTEAMILLQAYLGHPDLNDIDTALDDGDHVLLVSTMNRRVAACDYRGEALRFRPGGVLKMMQRYAEAAGIPLDEAHPHALRHLLGAELAENSTTPIEIQTILGHADVNTSAIYTRLALRKLTEIIDLANPLAKVNSPVADLVRELRKAGQL